MKLGSIISAFAVAAALSAGAHAQVRGDFTTGGLEVVVAKTDELKSRLAAEREELKKEANSNTARIKKIISNCTTILSAGVTFKDVRVNGGRHTVWLVNWVRSSRLYTLDRCALFNSVGWCRVKDQKLITATLNSLESGITAKSDHACRYQESK
jgi:hypothetical protein